MLKQGCQLLELAKVTGDVALPARRYRGNETLSVIIDRWCQANFQGIVSCVSGASLP